MKKDLFSWKDDQLNINIKLLALFSGPLTAWIFGLIYFYQQEIVIMGRAPLPVNNTLMTVIIIGAHLFSILVCGLIPRLSTWILRLTLPLCAVATLALLLPLETNITLILFYFIVFVSHNTAYLYGAIVSQHFTVGTAWLSSAFSIGIGGLFLAALLNDIYPATFTVFVPVSAIMLIMASGFMYILPLWPGTIRVPFSTWNDKIKLPVITYSGILGLIFLSTCLSIFAVHIASGIYHGFTFLFVSAAAFSLISIFGWTVLKSKAIKAFILYFVLILAGIGAAFFADSMSSMHLVACVFLGFAVSVSATWTFLLSVSFSMHPSRLTSSVGVLTKTAAAGLAGFICTLFKDYRLVLCIIFAVMAVLLLVVYLFMLKYFIYAFESKTLGTNIKLVGRPFSLPHKIQTSRDKHKFDNLSNVELMVVKLLMEGYPMLSIALNMCITYEAAKEHKANIYEKLGIRFKTGLFKLVSKKPYEF